MKNNEKYSEYGLQDFLDNDAFIRWVSGKEQDPVSAQFWSDFPVNYPAVSTNFDFAVSVVRSYRAQEFWDNKDNKAHLLERITATIETAAVRPARMRWMGRWAKAAAVIILIGTGGYFAADRLFRDPMEQIATGYGEMRTVTLPDHSVVILNASSSVKYNKKDPREVWIEGEAYFDVKPMDKKGFVVHSEAMTIDVLGTSFNVKSRHGKINVGLITGKIKVGFNEGNKATPHSVVMLPGDYIEYANNELLTTKKLEQPEKIKRWVDIQLTFTDATLGEIIETLQDNYGYTVKIADQSIKRLRIEGDINVTSVEDLLTVITTTLNVTIDQPSKKELIISKGK